MLLRHRRQLGRQQGIECRLDHPGADQDHQDAPGRHHAELGEAREIDRSQGAEDHERGAARGEHRPEGRADTDRNRLHERLPGAALLGDPRRGEDPIIRPQAEQDGEEGGGHEGQVTDRERRQRQAPQRPEPHRDEDGQRPADTPHHHQDQEPDERRGSPDHQGDVFLDGGVLLVFDGRQPGQPHLGRRATGFPGLRGRGHRDRLYPVDERPEDLEVLRRIPGTDEEEQHAPVARGEVAVGHALGPMASQHAVPVEAGGNLFRRQPALPLLEERG